MGRLSKLGETMFDNFFVSKILALEEPDLVGAFSKQMHLDNMQEKISNFIRLHPNGRFHIVAVEEKSDKKPVMLSLTNCPIEEIEFEYKIQIDPYWTGCVMEQLDDSGEHKIVIQTFSI